MANLVRSAASRLRDIHTKFRSQSFDSGPASASPETADEEPVFDEEKKENADCKRKKSFQQNSSIPEPLQVTVDDEKEKEKPPLERKKSKPQPVGTIPYEVTPSDTLVGIAAKFDTTPSNLLQINRMSCRIICPGQVLYVPGPDYNAVHNNSEPSSPITNTICEEDTPKDVSAPDKASSKVPGHAERLSSVTSPKEVVEITDPPRRITEEEARKLDEECVSRFLKFDAKHITDGQGVVNGTLIVTPNAIMFDPSVHDPLVIEHGSEKYGMVAAMETIISAAIYRDLKTMKIKGQANESDNTEIAKAEVYCGKGIFKFATSKQSDEPEYMDTTKKLAQVMQAVQSSQNEESGNAFVFNEPGENLQNSQTGDQVPEAENASKSQVTSGSSLENKVEQLSMTDISEHADNKGKTELTEQTKDNVPKVEPSGVPIERTSKRESMKKAKESETPANEPLTTDQGKVAAKGDSDQCSNSIQQGNTAPAVDSEGEPVSDPNASQPKVSPKDTTMTSSMIDGSPKLKAIYNYAAGFFHSSGSAEKTTTGTPEWPSPSAVIASEQTGERAPTSPTSPRAPGVEYTTKRGTRVRVVSAVTMEDKPNLFNPVANLKASSPTIRYEEPPLFLCLKVGKPKNTKVTYEAPFSTYGKAKKPEYWFTVSQEKADNFYAFLLHWKPEIYGDDEETEARKMGFVIFDASNNQSEEDLDILDEYFGHRESISKDWEIVTSDEAYRRKSLEIEDTPYLPELVGETHILTEEQITTLVEHLPGRTVGYSWVLIYSTDLHGFSLKTLYRDMANYDSPVLLVVRSTRSQVFGALISCPLKVSDHFYGTGESFLYTFYPTFRLFRWTGENNFFVKGNQESLAIGAGKGFFGLWFDGDLYHGRSHPCDTFGNDVLSEEEDFVVQAFEAWGFV